MNQSSNWVISPSTILTLAACPLPDKLDSIPLPELGQPVAQPRQQVVGMVSSGWMIYDGRWKLCKYATGEQVLFDLEEDPSEQHNRLDDPSVLTCASNWTRGSPRKSCDPFHCHMRTGAST